MLKNEMKRAFFGKGMLLALLIGIVAGILRCREIYELQNIVNEKLAKTDDIYLQMSFGTPFDYWILAYTSKFKIFIYYFIPVLAVLPFAGSFCMECRNGYYKNVLTRAGRMKYLGAKYIASFTAAGTAVVLPLVINLMWTFTFKCYQKPSPAGTSNMTYGSGELLGKLYFSHPFWYCFLYLLAIFIFSGSMAGITLLASKYIKNIFTVLLIPFLINIVVNMIIPIVDQYSYFLDPAVGGYRYVYGAAVCLVLFALTLVGSVVAGRRKDYL